MQRPRSSSRIPVARALRLGALAGSLLVAVLGFAVPSAVAATTPAVDLGVASTYAVLSGASVGNTVSAVGAPHTTLRGDLGVKANTQPTGFPPGVVTGTTRVGSTADAAHAAAVAAYAEIAARTGGAPLALALAGATVAPGLHTIAGAASNTTTVTLDAGGDPNAVFVFQVNGALAFAAGSHVVLAGGAQASRIFWQVNGAGAIGANADFAGTLIAMDAVAVGNSTIVNGRTFARNGALTLDNNQFYSSPPAVTIAGGAGAYTTDTTPTISGTTDIEAPGLVTVTIAGQTLTATPADGAWSVTSAILANATYPVVASVTDGAGNPGSATQQLTVDTVLPVVTLDGGSSVTTNDATPTISGTSDAAVGTIIRVTVDGQNLRALVHTGATWNIRAAALTDGTRTVTAAVTDPAGNEGTASQQLTVDTAAPAVMIAGGSDRLTNDATPAISGTAAVAEGTVVTVTLADETLTAPAGGGAWTVTAAALADGPHRVVMSVSDAAGNASSFTQTLTVDTVSPLVVIGGGASATTSDPDPTIVGSSTAAPGTTVTVTIAGQAMTTLVQANGTWNATPTTVGSGMWAVVASAPDPAGNVGSASQTLTISGPSAPPIDPVVTDSPPAKTDARAPAPGVASAPPTSVAAKTTVAPDGVQKISPLALSIGTKVTAPAKGAITVTASGSVKIKGVTKTIRLRTVTAKIAAGRSLTLKLEPNGTAKVAKAALKRIKAALAKGTKVTATITLKIVDAAGHTRTVKRVVRLKK
jgi:hypothetical protein